MKLKKLTLTNFQGMRSFTLDTEGGHDTSIFGDNAQGKTTIYNAFLWLLFEKNSLGVKDFEIKTRDENGNVIPSIDHAVEAVLEIDGKDVTLKRVYLEKYTKKRGASAAEFTGHITEHFVDGVPKSKGEYQEFVDNIAPEKLFMTITNPTYFNELLTWQDRRQILLGLCPPVDDAEIISGNPELAPLAEILSTRTVDDAKKVEAATRKKINDELNAIPGRIDEATRAIPGNATGNLEALATRAQKIAAEIEPLKAARLSVLSGGQAAELQKELSEIDHHILVMKNKHLAAAGASCESERKQLNEWGSQLQTLEMQVEADRGKASMLRKKIEGYKDASRDISARWISQNKKQFVPGAACPTCGQEYPEHLVDQQEADFKRAKAQALEAIVQNGKTNEASWKECESSLVALESKIVTDEKAAAILRDQVDSTRKIIASKATPPPFETLPEYLELDGQRQAIIQKIADLQAGNQSSLAEVDAKILEKGTELDEINRTITAIESAEGQRRRVEELKAREKELAKQFEQSEKILFLIEQFIRVKVSLLEEAINNRFEIVRFKLFDQAINGGVTETCVCTVGGVPYPSVNNGARIQAGCEIVAVLQDHYNLLAPVFIDNRESVTSLPPLPCQTISLVVSEADKALRIEIQ
jgi:hypothetical protein